MAKYTTPRVYTDESHFNLPVIEELPAGIPAFIGYTTRATQEADNDLLQVPKLIRSEADYAQFYGMPGETSACAVMHEGVKLYFKKRG